MNPGRIVILCLLCAAIISGCGRRGGLEKPTNAQAADRTVAPEQQAEPPRAFQKNKVPDRPFILDGLI